MSATAPLYQPLFTAATAVATSQPFDCSEHPLLTLYVSVSGTLGAGTLILEEAAYDPLKAQTYAGTWSPIQTIDLTGIADLNMVAYHIGGPGGTFAFKMVRARISVAVTSGTVTAVLCGTGVD